MATQADPDVYRQIAHKANGDNSFELLLVYMVDTLTCSNAHQAIIDNLALK